MYKLWSREDCLASSIIMKATCICSACFKVCQSSPSLIAHSVEHSHFAVALLDDTCATIWVVSFCAKLMSRLAATSPSCLSAQLVGWRPLSRNTIHIKKSDLARDSRNAIIIQQRSVYGTERRNCFSPSLSPQKYATLELG